LPSTLGMACSVVCSGCSLVSRRCLADSQIGPTSPTKGAGPWFVSPGHSITCGSFPESGRRVMDFLGERCPGTVACQLVCRPDPGGILGWSQRSCLFTSRRSSAAAPIARQSGFSLALRLANAAPHAAVFLAACRTILAGLARVWFGLALLLGSAAGVGP